MRLALAQGNFANNFSVKTIYRVTDTEHLVKGSDATFCNAVSVNKHDSGATKRSNGNASSSSDGSPFGISHAVSGATHGGGRRRRVRREPLPLRLAGEAQRAADVGPQYVYDPHRPQPVEPWLEAARLEWRTCRRGPPGTEDADVTLSDAPPARNAGLAAEVSPPAHRARP